MPAARPSRQKRERDRRKEPDWGLLRSDFEKIWSERMIFGAPSRNF